MAKEKVANPAVKAKVDKAKAEEKVKVEKPVVKAAKEKKVVAKKSKVSST